MILVLFEDVVSDSAEQAQKLHEFHPLVGLCIATFISDGHLATSVQYLCFESANLEHISQDIIDGFALRNEFTTC